MPIFVLAIIICSPLQYSGADDRAGSVSHPVGAFSQSQEPDAVLYFSPSSKDVAVAETFSLEIVIDPGSNEVNAMSVCFDYPANYLQCESIEVATDWIKLLAKIDNTTGTATLDAGYCLGCGMLTTPKTVATVKFKAKSAGIYSITFNDKSVVYDAELQSARPATIFAGGAMIGTEPGLYETMLPAEKVVDLMINTTNRYGHTPIYEWLVYTSVVDGVALPIYIVSDTGAYDYNQIMHNLYSYTYTFGSGNTSKYKTVSMSGLGLSEGDSHAYAYAYQNASNQIIMENIVLITVY